MKEHKPSAEDAQVTVTYLHPKSGTEPPSPTDTAAGEVTVFVQTDGKPHTLVLVHNFNLNPDQIERRLPDVLFEAEDVDFYQQKPTIVKRGANSVSIALNPDAMFKFEATKFVVKLKRST
jgi:hypothetical protein